MTDEWKITVVTHLAENKELDEDTVEKLKNNDDFIIKLLTYSNRIISRVPPNPANLYGTIYHCFTNDSRSSILRTNLLELLRSIRYKFPQTLYALSWENLPAPDHIVTTLYEEFNVLLYAELTETEIFKKIYYILYYFNDKFTSVSDLKNSIQLRKLEGSLSRMENNICTKLDELSSELRELNGTLKQFYDVFVSLALTDKDGNINIFKN